jgi:hypothetical protein
LAFRSVIAIVASVAAFRLDDFRFSTAVPAFLLAIALFSAPSVASQEVDLQLVFAADGSGSIDDEELRLQRDGYATALADPAVLSVIAAGPRQRIAVAYMEWGGPESQHTIIDWTVIAGADDARAFGDLLRTRPRAAYGYNSISEALAYSARMIRDSGFESPRKVIDLSGDGPQIGGRPLPLIRQAVLAEGITINALVVANRGIRPGPGGGSLEDHYWNDVVGGLGAFVVVADDEAGFTRKLMGKIVREIADRNPTGDPARQLAQYGAGR